MYLHRTLFMLILACYFNNSAFADSITVSEGDITVTPNVVIPNIEVTSTGDDINLSDGNTQIHVSNEYSIFVDGDLYLDYSVFSENEDLDIGDDISIAGETVTIFSFEQEPTMPDLSLTAIFQNPGLSISEDGNILLFSESPILSGVFESTGSLYIGDYSSLKPVPLPELPFGITSLIIELTDSDIELQAFVDGVEWENLQIFGPNESRIFNLGTQRNLPGLGGLSELFFASEPTHYLEEEPEFDGTIEEFLARFPAGEYEFEGVTVNGGELEGEAVLTHVLPALPQIIAPLSDGGDPPVVDPNDLVIEWRPVTTRFIGDGLVEILEYQVILDQVDPLRGKIRRALINLPASVTVLRVPPEFLRPDSQYEFEVLAMEESGNSTISVGGFVTE